MRDPNTERIESSRDTKQGLVIWRTLRDVLSEVRPPRTLRVSNTTEGLVIEMAKNTKQSAWGNIEFLDFRLDRSDERDFEKWAQENSSKWGDYVDDLLAEGYKISISPDMRNMCTIVTLTDRSEKGLNANTCFSSRAELWVDAMLLMLYKHFVVANGQQWPKDHTRANWG